MRPSFSTNALHDLRARRRSSSVVSFSNSASISARLIFQPILRANHWPRNALTLPVGLGDETTGLRDFRTTGPPDHRTTGQQDNKTRGAHASRVRSPGPVVPSSGRPVVRSSPSHAVPVPGCPFSTNLTNAGSKVALENFAAALSKASLFPRLPSDEIRRMWCTTDFMSACLAQPQAASSAKSARMSPHDRAQPTARPNR